MRIETIKADGIPTVWCCGKDISKPCRERSEAIILILEKIKDQLNNDRLPLWCLVDLIPPDYAYKVGGPAAFGAEIRNL